LIGIKTGRPKKQVPDEWRQIINKKFQKHRLNVLYLEKTIYYNYKIRIPHNTIHKVLLEQGFAKKDVKKQGRRKPWIRYERKHSLSAIHLDWHDSKYNNLKVCVAIADASRKILAGGEFESATAENSILIVQEVINEYGYIRVVRETITDHGSQFTANQTDKKGNSNGLFEKFLRENGIKHIKCRIKHPQTNGEVEKWFDFYERFRPKQESFENLISWYNNRPHGSLNLRRAETPMLAFKRKLPIEYWFGLSNNFIKW